MHCVAARSPNLIFSQAILWPLAPFHMCGTLAVRAASAIFYDDWPKSAATSGKISGSFVCAYLSKPVKEQITTSRARSLVLSESGFLSRCPVMQ